MGRRIVLAAVVVLVPAGSAFAHGPHGVNGTGYVASVNVVDPQVLGLEAKVILDDQLLVSNLTQKPLQILDRRGRPFIRFRPEGVERLLDGRWRRMNTGAAYAWHDSRVVGSGTPPPAAPGATETAPRFVRNWTVPGRLGDRAFSIEGALAWVEPPRNRAVAPRQRCSSEAPSPWPPSRSVRCSCSVAADRTVSIFLCPAT